MSWDFYFFQQINGLAGKYIWLDLTGIFFAKYFEYFLTAFVILLLLSDRKKYLSMVVLGLVSAVVARLGVVELIRFFLPKARPFVENNVNLLMDKVNQSSFPSGHAAFFFALSTIVYFYNKKAGILFFVASFLISIARVFMGVHWPSDILAGAIVGIFCAIVVNSVYHKFVPGERVELS